MKGAEYGPSFLVIGHSPGTSPRSKAAAERPLEGMCSFSLSTPLRSQVCSVKCVPQTGWKPSISNTLFSETEDNVE